MFDLSAHPVTGRPAAWARDLAALGGATSGALGVLFLGFTPGAFPPVVGAVTAASGAALGLAMPRLLDAVRGRLPLPLLVAGAVTLGAGWGGGSGLLAGLIVGEGTWAFGLLAGALAGGAQLGWFWLPYTVQTVRGGRTWPLLVGACLALPALALLTFYGVLLSVGLFSAMAVLSP